MLRSRLVSHNSTLVEDPTNKYQFGHVGTKKTGGISPAMVALTDKTGSVEDSCHQDNVLGEDFLMSA